MIIKQGTGKLTLTGGDVQSLLTELIDDGAAVLDASVLHMLRLAALPARHRDPFDRLLERGDRNSRVEADGPEN
jgi:PIN domain nuclease of toxin-antitoxin system